MDLHVAVPGRRQQSYLPPKFEATYAFKEVIGSGAFSKVHRGVHRETKQDVAVKVVDSSDLRLDILVLQRRLMKEVEVLKQCKHENVVKLEDVFQTPSHLFIVLEMVNGGELFNHILEAGHYSETVARGLFKQVLQAAAYLHQHGIVHRDIKPENILLHWKPDDAERDINSAVVKLSDFGLAKFMERVDLASAEAFTPPASSFGGTASFGGRMPRHTVCGTPQYGAPEVASGYYGKAVDCWSLGVLLYVMLSGYFPYEATSMVVRSDLCKPCFDDPIWQEMSPSAKSLIERLMDADPSTRCTCEEAVQHEWLADKVSTSHLNGIPQLMRRRSMEWSTLTSTALKSVQSHQQSFESVSGASSSASTVIASPTTPATPFSKPDLGDLNKLLSEGSGPVRAGSLVGRVSPVALGVVETGGIGETTGPAGKVGPPAAHSTSVTEQEDLWFTQEQGAGDASCKRQRLVEPRQD